VPTINKPIAQNCLNVNIAITPESYNPAPMQLPTVVPILSTLGDGVRNFFDFSIIEFVKFNDLSVAFLVVSNIFF
jgi:hypothetical protein